MDSTGALSLQFSKLEIDKEERKSLNRHFLFPRKELCSPLPNEVDPQPYLAHVKQQILAEFWAFFTNALDSPQDSLTEILLQEVAAGGNQKPTFRVTDQRGRGENDDGEFSSHLILMSGRLGLLCFHQASGTYRLSLGLTLSSLDKKYASKTYTFGYIGNRVKDLEAVINLSAMEHVPSLIRSAGRPSIRTSQRYSRVGAYACNQPINRSQENAIEGFKHDLEFIQGPPGTGKSTTIYHIIQRYVKPTESALVSCVSNKAVDAIAEKFAKCNFPFIVVGKDDRLGSTAKLWTLEAQVERHDSVKTQVKVLDLLARYSDTMDKAPASRRERTADSVGHKLRSMNLGSIVASAEETAKDTLSSASSSSFYSCLWASLQDFIVSSQSHLSKLRAEVSLNLKRTCVAVLVTIDSCGSAVRLLDEGVEDKTALIGSRMHMVVLDEAGTIPEAKICTIVSNLPTVTRIVSIGDQQQLEPFSDIRKNNNEETSGFFHRALRVLTSQVPMLNIQFRMHPKICKFVSNLAYNSRLQTAGVTSTQRLSEVSNDQAIRWLSYDKGRRGGEHKPDNKSVINRKEVKIVCDLVQNQLPILKQEGSKSLLVITFYKGQLREIREELVRRGVLDRDPKTKQPIDPPDASLRVATVDSAQGSEADVVILSCVRSNHNSNVGFLKNMNRAVVALSRARERLVIVGDETTIASRKGAWRCAYRSSTVCKV